MKIKFLFILLTATLSAKQLHAQADSLSLRTQRIAMIDSTQTEHKAYNPLAPAKAAFYSAIFPGLGQAYNGSYWKIPIVYAALGGSVYMYIKNENEYQRYRDAYKRRLAGYEDDEFQGRLDTNRLIDAQKIYRRNKEIWLLVTTLGYILNIVDANVDAHLQQFNVNNDLSLKPNLDFDRMSGTTSFGLSLNINF